MNEIRYNYWCDYLNFGKPIGDYVYSTNSGICFKFESSNFIEDIIQIGTEELTK